ncbi:MAG: HNH endonuclease [Methylomonas sp.]|jgi:hypothetical protein|uniref:HNH endonuclease family protein n=1 Tax=Methylomonas sp. TaxID=418 RepID=UPI0025FC2C5C|nr:HNH endonuclease [Methylomonas sp.]MCK9607829.1 HNH endonuclease [Methylomonas sp.]
MAAEIKPNIPAITKITIRELHCYSSRVNAERDKKIFIDIHPYYQRAYEPWDSRARTALIETILLGRVMNPIWFIPNITAHSIECIDGMHRICNILDFIKDDGFVLGKFVEWSPYCALAGKRFVELPVELREKIWNYALVANHLEEAYRESPAQLQYVYELLNGASKPLNSYELNRVRFANFYEFLAECRSDFPATSPIARGANIARGQLDKRLVIIIAVYRDPLLRDLTRREGVFEAWINANLAKITPQVAAEIKESLIKMRNYADDMREIGIFRGEQGENLEGLVVHEHFLYIVARCAALIHNKEKFRRIARVDLAAKFRTLLQKQNLCVELKQRDRGIKFIRALIHYIDAIITSSLEEFDTKRCFSRDLIAGKLKLQGGMCAICGIAVDIGDAEGDHIVPYSSGGMTTPENLQVVHRHCNRAK